MRRNGMQGMQRGAPRKRPCTRCALPQAGYIRGRATRRQGCRRIFRTGFSRPAGSAWLKARARAFPSGSNPPGSFPAGLAATRGFAKKFSFRAEDGWRPCVAISAGAIRIPCPWVVRFSMSGSTRGTSTSTGRIVLPPGDGR